MKFKRAFLMEPHRFEIHEVEEEPGPGEVMMKVASCGLCNWELNFWDGNLNFMGYPHKLGHEFAGTVVKLGPGCTKFKVGDKISAVARGFGGFAEYRATPEACCEKLADNIDPKYALGEPQKCILTVLRATAPQAADYGVVLGCGPMGMWCIQALAGNYLAGLIAIDVDDAKAVLDLCTAAVFAVTLGVAVAVIALPMLTVMLVLFFAAGAIAPFVTPEMLQDFISCGGVLTIVAGMRVSGIKQYPIANMIPALLLVLPASAIWQTLMV